MIVVKQMDEVGVDARGYTFEYFHERYGRHLVCFRHANTISGRHYHKGISITKNPEILLLMQGRVQLNYREVNSAQLQQMVINAPVQIEIPPFIWHEVVAITDCCFIELNSLSEHELDTFTEG